MSAAGCQLTEDQFLCSICLDVFTLPVTLPCGHNFCKSCITHHWDVNVFCICPVCKERFDIKPNLSINHFISDMANRFRESAVNTASSNPELQVAKPGEVYCDECVGAKVKAVKSCLVCLTSYCETHLKPHWTTYGLKRHELVDPVENLEGRMCPKHNKPLELFCRTDRTNVCMLCSLLDHKTHMLVPLKEEHERRKAMLGKTEGKMYRMIQERRLKIEEITLSGKLNKESADREMAVGVQVFTDLMQFLEGGLAERSVYVLVIGCFFQKRENPMTKTYTDPELIEMIEEKLKTTGRQAEGFITELEQEIYELVKRSTEVDQLSRSDDHFHLLQSFSAVNAAPPTKDWTEVGIQQPRYEEMVRRVVVEAVDRLQETFRKEKKKLLEAELKKVQQCEVEVTLDPETASPWLVLSDHDKQVSLGDMKKTLPKTPERFYPGGGILAKQSFSCGRFYYEVQVKEKMKWDLGVVRESISRKGKVTKNQESGLWILRKANEYKACDGSRDVHLSLTWHPRKIGVFVDYDGGLVSFYDVDAADLIFSFTDCHFTERLFLIISPVNHSD